MLETQGSVYFQSQVFRVMVALLPGKHLTKVKTVSVIFYPWTLLQCVLDHRYISPVAKEQLLELECSLRSARTCHRANFLCPKITSWKTVFLWKQNKEIKYVANSFQGSHTGQLHFRNWQMAVRRDNVISITHHQAY